MNDDYYSVELNGTVGNALNLINKDCNSVVASSYRRQIIFVELLYF